MDPGPSGLKEDRGSNLSGRPRLRLWGPGLGGRRGGWGAGWGQRQASLGKHPRDSLAEHKSGPLQFFGQLCRRHGITATFLHARSFHEMAVILNKALVAKYPAPVMSPPASAPPVSPPPGLLPPAAASALSAVKAGPEPAKEEPCAADSAPASRAEELGAASAADEAAANAAPLGAAASVAEDLGAASAADEARELIYVRTYPPPPAPPPDPKLKGFRAWECEI